LWNNLSEKDKESLLHEKKVAVEETEKIVPKKIPASTDIKNNLDEEPSKKSATMSSVPTINKKSDGSDRYREPIE
jgi:hypothetical protein